MDEINQNLIIQSLLKEIGDLKKRVDAVESIKNDIPTREEVIQDISITKHAPFKITPLKLKSKRGKGARPLIQSEILEAQEKAKSAAQAAKYLNVSYSTYVKYAKLYDIHKNFTNKCGKGVSKPRNPKTGKYPLDDILNCKYPDYPLFKLKDRLIRAGLKSAQCEQCGYNERRLSDGKIPLLIIFEDNNEKNKRLENMKIFCYNCSFTAGKIWVKIKDRSRWLNDPARLQGAEEDTKQNF